jgi:hypothetical protein
VQRLPHSKIDFIKELRQQGVYQPYKKLTRFKLGVLQRLGVHASQKVSRVRTRLLTTLRLTYYPLPALELALVLRY